MFVPYRILIIHLYLRPLAAKGVGDLGFVLTTNSSTHTHTHTRFIIEFVFEIKISSASSREAIFAILEFVNLYQLKFWIEIDH